MEIVEMDKRGRMTLPAKFRENLDSNRFLVTFRNKSIQLTPVPTPKDLKGSVEIPWSIDELEEAGEEFVKKRAEG